MAIERVRTLFRRRHSLWCPPGFDPRLMENVPCDYCGESDYAVVYPGEVGVEMSPAVVKCRKCGLCFLNRRPKTSALEFLDSSEYYNSEKSSRIGYTDYAGDKYNTLNTFAKRRQLIQKHLQTGPRVRLLDVGCGFGHGSEAAARLSWEAESVDVPIAAVKRCSPGLKVERADFLSYARDRADESFDVNTMWDSCGNAV